MKMNCLKITKITLKQSEHDLSRPENVVFSPRKLHNN